ncbi:MAG: phosphoserine phosphatase SerB, partial [Pseudomonadota bacterium]
KKLRIADMESTVIKEECLDELAAALGIGEKIADITQRAMNAEISFEAALRERVGLLAGLDEGVLAQLRDTGLTIMPGARALVATMRAHGAFCALVSGGFTYFAEPVGTALGFDHVQANRIDIADGRLTGDVIPPILGREAKRTALEAIAADRGVSIGDAVCVGDGANDLAMLKAATELGGIGVAFNAKPAVAREANVRIDHSGLDALLYLQGYREAEVVTPAAA